MIATSLTNGYLPKRSATVCRTSAFWFSVIMEPLKKKIALATKTGTRDGAKPEVPGTNATPTLTGRVKTGVPDATSTCLLGYRNSPVLVTFRAVFAHPASANTNPNVRPSCRYQVPLRILDMRFPQVVCGDG